MQSNKITPDYCVDCEHYVRGNHPGLDKCKKDGRRCMTKRKHARKTAGFKCKDFKQRKNHEKARQTTTTEKDGMCQSADVTATAGNTEL